MEAGVSQDAVTRASLFGLDVDWTSPPWEQRWTVPDSGGADVGRGRRGPRRSGEAVRWAAAYEEPTWTGVFDHDEDILGVASLADGGSLLFGKPANTGYLARHDQYGEVERASVQPPGTASIPVAAVQLPDGTVLVASQLGASVWLRRLAGDGSTLEAWAGRCNPSCTVTDMVLGVDELGGPVVVGRSGDLGGGSTAWAFQVDPGTVPGGFVAPLLTRTALATPSHPAPKGSMP